MKEFDEGSQKLNHEILCHKKLNRKKVFYDAVLYGCPDDVKRYCNDGKEKSKLNRKHRAQESPLPRSLSGIIMNGDLSIKHEAGLRSPPLHKERASCMI